jgi:hypothetical protein
MTKVERATVLALALAVQHNVIRLGTALDILVQDRVPLERPDMYALFRTEIRNRCPGLWPEDDYA